MLLLGVLQAQAAGQVAAGSFDLLETQVLASSAASVTFSSLSTYAADYQHLQIRMIVASNINRNIQIQLGTTSNDATAGNYKSHFLFGDGSSVGSGVYSNVYAGMYNGSSSNSITTPASVVTDILDFANSSKNTTIRSLHGFNSSSSVVQLTSGVWLNTAAPNLIHIYVGGGDIATGSRFSLYGIKAA